MLARQQAIELLKARRDRGSLFSALPDELILMICNYNYNRDPNSDIAKALQFAAYARKGDEEALLKMVGQDPYLLLEAGDVQGPEGNIYKRVTLYEFVLGAGDYDLKARLEPYFSKIKNGEKERSFQYEKYRPYIEGMLTQTPYDVTHLFQLIKAATPGDVRALLNKNLAGVQNANLHNAMVKFIKDWAPKTIMQPCMHYNYMSLYHVFDLLVTEWGNLYNASGKNFDLINLIWRQLAGRELRRLPGIDRCIVAQGIFVLNQNNSLARSYTFTTANNIAIEFPITLSDDSLDGLGGDFSIDVVFGWVLACGGKAPAAWDARIWKIYVEQKHQACRTYAATTASLSADKVCNVLK
jgi:hypothetical protein